MSSDIPSQPSTTSVRALKLYGRVQGVGFRWWTCRQAEQLGLRGSVRNCRDGTVDVKMGGPPERLEEMANRLSEGPPAARVSRIEELEPPTDLPDGFEIVH